MKHRCVCVLQLPATANGGGGIYEYGDDDDDGNAENKNALKILPMILAKTMMAMLMNMQIVSVIKFMNTCIYLVVKAGLLASGFSCSPRPP